MSGPLVSVILPTRNRAAALRRSALSVLNQSYDRLELIVVDDASADGTAEAVRSLADGRLRYIALETSRGCGGARNAGLPLAKGAWIAFQDSDDLWHPDKLRRQVEAAAAMPGRFVAVYTSYWRIAGASRKRLPKPGPGLEGDVQARLARGNFVTFQTFMIRADTVRAVGEFDEHLSALEDWDYALRAARLGAFLWIREPLVEYRLGEDSLTVSPDRFVENYRYLMEKHRATLLADPAAEAWHWAVIGNRLCRDGSRGRGRPYLRLAWRLRPFDARYAGAWACSFLCGPFYRRMTRMYGALFGS